MDVREKLAELLENHCAVIGEDHCKASQSGKCTPRDCAICLASDLISNGVTVQEWISVKDRLPDDWVDVLARLQCGDCVVAVKSGPIWLERFINIRLEDGDVTHWMPLSQPPKGE